MGEGHWSQSTGGTGFAVFSQQGRGHHVAVGLQLQAQHRLGACSFEAILYMRPRSCICDRNGREDAGRQQVTCSGRRGS